MDEDPGQRNGTIDLIRSSAAESSGDTVDG